MSPLFRAALIGAIVLPIAACWREIVHTGVVSDEVAYYSLALRVRDDLDFVDFATWGVAPLPIVAFHGPASLFDRRPPREPHYNIFIGDSGDSRYIEIARLFSAPTCGAVIGLCTFLWLRRRAGPWAAIAGAVFLGASTMIVAHTSLATTDAAFTAATLVAIALIDRRRRLRTRSSDLAALFAIGACFATKYSAAGLLPLFAWGLVDGTVGWRQWLFAFIRQCLRVGVAAIVVGWMAHGFAVAPIKTHPTPDAELGPGLKSKIKGIVERIYVPASIKGFLVQANMAVGMTSSTYLTGRWSETGWRSFYLVGMAVKSDPAELLLLAVGLVVAIAVIVAAMGGKATDPEVLLRAVVVVGLLIVVSLGKKQLGVRYALPAYPLLGMLAIAFCWKSTAGRWLATSALICHLFFFAVAPPGLLSYFSPAFGGRLQGDRWLVGLDYEWGQGLTALADWYRREGGGRPVFYVGQGHPGHFDVEAIPNSQFDAIKHRQAWLFLSKAALREPGALSELLAMTPDATPSDVNVVFDLTRPEVSRVFAKYIAGVP